MTTRTVGLAALLAALVSPARAAELRAVGPEHVLSTSYCGALAVRDSGRYAVGWVQSDPVDPGLALVVRVVDEADVALPAVEVEPSIVSLPLDASVSATDAGFALQWYENQHLGSEASVKIQDLDVAGLPVGAPFVAPVAARTFTAHRSGGRIVTAPARGGILVSVEDAAGRPLGRPVSIGDRHVVWRQVMTRPDGGFVVAYGSRQRVDNRLQDLGVRAVSFDREGRLASPPVLVARPRTYLVALAVGADGTLAAIVRSATNSLVMTLHTFDRRGRVLGSLRLPAAVSGVALGVDRLGNVLMVWNRDRPDEGTGRAQLFSRRLQPLAPAVALAAVLPGQPRVDTCMSVGAAADSFVVSWTRYDYGINSELRARRLVLAD